MQREILIDLPFRDDGQVQLRLSGAVLRISATRWHFDASKSGRFSWLAGNIPVAIILTFINLSLGPVMTR